ncbi:MAG: o-succinylbenzoate synthase [Chlamydiota bacterium]
MRMQTFSLHPYEIPLTQGQPRLGVLIHITDEQGNSGWGDIAPLPKWSKETLEEALEELELKKEKILKIKSLEDALKLSLLPSVAFGLESALLSLLEPLPPHVVLTSALLMGSLEEILQQAALRKKEGYFSAKLKVGNLSFKEAAEAIWQLKDVFRLRIDVNRAWKTQDSLEFFSNFPLDAFDYVEEPFQDPNDLALFTHPLAVDESFPKDLTLKDLEALPKLKALIYKPTIQGGMSGYKPLLEWANKRGIDLVLSSSFESDIGLLQIASLARRLSLKAPVGIGTYHFLQSYLSKDPVTFSESRVYIS